MLERAQVRAQQNSANHQRHVEEIALGIANGPISDKYRYTSCSAVRMRPCFNIACIGRSVAEKSDRPLSRVRPNSAVEEKVTIQQTRATLTRFITCLLV